MLDEFHLIWTMLVILDGSSQVIDLWIIMNKHELCNIIREINKIDLAERQAEHLL